MLTGIWITRVPAGICETKSLEMSVAYHKPCNLTVSQVPHDNSKLTSVSVTPLFLVGEGRFYNARFSFVHNRDMTKINLHYLLARLMKIRFFRCKNNFALTIDRRAS